MAKRLFINTSEALVTEVLIFFFNTEAYQFTFKKIERICMENETF